MKLRSLTFHTASQVLGKAISLLVGLSITALITKQLPSKEAYGQYLLIINFVLQLIAVSEWGTGFIAVRAASQKKFPSQQIFSTLLLFRVATGLLAVGLFTVAGLFSLFSIPLSTYILASCLILPTTFKNVTQSIFQTKLQYTTFATLETCINLFYLLGLWYFSSHTILSLNQTLGLLTISISLVTIVSLVLTRKSLLPLSFNFPILKYLLQESLPMGTQLLLFNLYNRMDIYFLEKFRGTLEVAYYGLAYKLFENLVQPAAFFMNTLYPHLSSQNTTEFRNSFKLAATILTLISFTGMVITILAAPFIVHLINPQYQKSIFLLQLLALTLPWTYVNHLLGFSCIAQGAQKTWMRIAAIAFIINVSTNLLLLPHYGATAAAITTILTESAITILAFKFLSSKLSLTYSDLHPSNLLSQLRNLRRSW